MPRARSNKTYRQTAAAPQDGSSCLSVLMLPPLAVLIVSAALAMIALNIPFKTFRADTPPSLSNLSPLFRPEIQYWSGSIIQWAAATNLDPNLVAVIMQIESCGNPRTQSRAGAMGLFQVMPFHFYAIDNPYNPDTNAARGLAYLQKSLETAGGNARLALAGYNGGIGVIGHAEWAWPAETKRYVQYGASIYEDARNGAASSSMLDEWYSKYGISLCKQARENLGLP
jgi:soluble lytic murein transglycosylase-like protein